MTVSTGSGAAAGASNPFQSSGRKCHQGEEGECHCLARSRTLPQPDQGHRERALAGVRWVGITPPTPISLCASMRAELSLGVGAAHRPPLIDHYACGSCVSDCGRDHAARPASAVRQADPQDVPRQCDHSSSWVLARSLWKSFRPSSPRGNAVRSGGVTGRASESVS